MKTKSLLSRSIAVDLLLILFWLLTFPFKAVASTTSPPCSDGLMKPFVTYFVSWTSDYALHPENVNYIRFDPNHRVTDGLENNYWVSSVAGHRQMITDNRRSHILYTTDGSAKCAYRVTFFIIVRTCPELTNACTKSQIPIFNLEGTSGYDPLTHHLKECTVRFHITAKGAVEQSEITCKVSDLALE